jgi:hypothetical protein
MLYESIALPLSYVGWRRPSISIELAGFDDSGGRAELGRVQAGFVGALAAHAVLALAIVAEQLVGGRLGATTESALPVHDRRSRPPPLSGRRLERGYEKVEAKPSATRTNDSASSAAGS